MPTVVRWNKAWMAVEVWSVFVYSKRITETYRFSGLSWSEKVMFLLVFVCWQGESASFQDASLVTWPGRSTNVCLMLRGSAYGGRGYASRQTPLGYDQHTVGRHPTGMHSCFQNEDVEIGPLGTLATTEFFRMEFCRIYNIYGLCRRLFLVISFSKSPKIVFFTESVEFFEDYF